VISADDFPAVQRAVRKVHQRAERATGAADQLLGQIRDEFGCKDREAARAKLEEMQAERQRTLVKYNRMVMEFKKENAAALQEVSGLEDSE
jgi:hypothetical protein